MPLAVHIWYKQRCDCTNACGTHHLVPSLLQDHDLSPDDNITGSSSSRATSSSSPGQLPTTLSPDQYSTSAFMTKIGLGDNLEKVHPSMLLEVAADAGLLLPQRLQALRMIAQPAAVANLEELFAAWLATADQDEAVRYACSNWSAFTAQQVGRGM